MAVIVSHIFLTICLGILGWHIIGVNTVFKAVFFVPFLNFHRSAKLLAQLYFDPQLVIQIRCAVNVGVCFCFWYFWQRIDNQTRIIIVHVNVLVCFEALPTLVFGYQEALTLAGSVHLLTELLLTVLRRDSIGFLLQRFDLWRLELVENIFFPLIRDLSFFNEIQNIYRSIEINVLSHPFLVLRTIRTRSRPIHQD